MSNFEVLLISIYCLARSYCHVSHMYITPQIQMLSLCDLNVEAIMSGEFTRELAAFISKHLTSLLHCSQLLLTPGLILHSICTPLALISWKLLNSSMVNIYNTLNGCRDIVSHADNHCMFGSDQRSSERNDELVSITRTSYT